MLDSQMGALMRAAVERQGIGLMDAVDRHRYLLEAVESGNVGRLRRVIRAALPSGCSSSMAGLSRASLVEHVAEAAGCTHMTGTSTHMTRHVADSFFVALATAVPSARSRMPH